MRFRVSGKELEILEAQVRQEPFVVFGVRACDCRALEILDRVFLAEPEDSFTGTGGSMAPWYPWPAMSRRRPASAEPLGLTPEIRREMCPPGSGRIPCISGPTRKRERRSWQSCLWKRAGETAVEQAQGAARAIQDRLPLRGLTTEGFGRKEAMLELFHRPEWDRLSESRLGCGACTFVCPTCQCYDIKEFTGKEEVCRYRCWDSCMYSDFTLMSAGQPRPTQKERFRQRFLHKLQYFPVNQDGVFGCVGRAAGACSGAPIHMNIVKVMKTLGGAPHES